MSFTHTLYTYFRININRLLLFCFLGALVNPILFQSQVIQQIAMTSYLFMGCAMPRHRIAALASICSSIWCDFSFCGSVTSISIYYITVDIWMDTRWANSIAAPVANAWLHCNLANPSRAHFCMMCLGQCLWSHNPKKCRMSNNQHISRSLTSFSRSPNNHVPFRYK